MKRLLLLFVFFFVYSFNTYAQTGIQEHPEVDGKFILYNKSTWTVEFEIRKTYTYCDGKKSVSTLTKTLRPQSKTTLGGKNLDCWNSDGTTKSNYEIISEKQS